MLTLKPSPSPVPPPAPSRSGGAPPTPGTVRHVQRDAPARPLARRSIPGVPLPWWTSQSMIATRSTPRRTRRLGRQRRVREQAVAVGHRRLRRGGRAGAPARRTRALAIQHRPTAPPSPCRPRPATAGQLAGARPCSRPAPRRPLAELAHVLDIAGLVQHHQLVHRGVAAVPPAQPVGDRPVLAGRADVADAHVVLGVQLRDLDQRRRGVLEHAAPVSCSSMSSCQKTSMDRIGHGRGSLRRTAAATSPAIVLRSATRAFCSVS